MKADIYFDPSRYMYEIRVLDDSRRLALNSDKIWVHVEPGVKHPTFLELEPEVYGAIAGSMLDLGIPGKPDELQDCRKIRDRLLTLVEQVVNGDHP